MSILVLVSQAPHSFVLPSPGPTDPGAPSRVHQGISPGDLHAVEAAVQLRETLQAPVVVVALGAPLADTALREALVQGADEAVRIYDERLTDCDAQVAARILAAQVARLKPELVLCGVRSGTGGTGQVGPSVAEHLGWAFVGPVVRLELKAGYAMIEQVEEHSGRRTLRCKLPAILAAAPQLAQPRYVPLRQRLRAARAEIQISTMKDLGILPDDPIWTKSQVQVVSLSLAKLRPKKILTPDSRLPAAERIRLLMSGGLVQKQGTVVDTSAGEAADAIVKILSREKII